VRFNSIPPQPDKSRIISLLDKNHAHNVQDWTTAEQIEMVEALRAVSFYWYRDERFIKQERLYDFQTSFISKHAKGSFGT